MPSRHSSFSSISRRTSFPDLLGGFGSEYQQSDILGSQFQQSTFPLSTPSRELLPLARSWAARRTASLQRAASAPDLAAAAVNLANLNRPDPPFEGNVDSRALTAEDEGLMANFHKAQDFVECPRCRRRWFDVRLIKGICSKCHAADDRKRPEDPNFWTRANGLDFGDVPAHLPKLSQLEEQLIARVHVHVEVMSVRGAQYKYRGHVVSFLRDVGKIYSQLPLLPQDVELLMIRPANATNQPHVVRQFKRNFYVNQNNIRIWLEFLKENHPGYADITISEENLSQLPQDGDVMDQIPHHQGPNVEMGALIDEDDDLSDFPEVAALPNLLADQNQLDAFRQQLGGPSGTAHGHAQVPLQPVQPYIVNAPFRSTPLSEFNRSQALLSWAFPTLYPYGAADFVTPRQRAVKYRAYLEFAMRWHDGRFARHERFRFVAYNTLMRYQVNTKSRFYVKHKADAPIDVEALREAFALDTDESKALLKSVVRFSDTVLGTRPYWNSKRAGLEAFVHQLGMPIMFCTFSPADYHWRSLARHMPQFDRWLAAPERERLGISRVNLRDNPHIAAWHFHTRFTASREHVITPKFNVTDYWDRYEWQARGSPHNHGLYWSHGAPIADMDSEEGRRTFALFWSRHISALVFMCVLYCSTFPPRPGEWGMEWSD